MLVRKDQDNTSGFQVVGTEVLAAERTMNCQGRSDIEPFKRKKPSAKVALSCQIGGDSGSMHSAAANCNQSSSKAPEMGTSSLAKEVHETIPDVSTAAVSYETTALAKEMREATMNEGTSTALTKEVNEATPNEGTSTALVKALVNVATPNEDTYSMSHGRKTALAKEVNQASGIIEPTLTMNKSTLGQIETSCAIPGINQPEERIQAGTSHA